MLKLRIESGEFFFSNFGNYKTQVKPNLHPLKKMPFFKICPKKNMLLVRLI